MTKKCLVSHCHQALLLTSLSLAIGINGIAYAAEKSGSEAATATGAVQPSSADSRSNQGTPAADASTSASVVDTPSVGASTSPVTPNTSPDGGSAASAVEPKMIVKPGMPISVNMAAEDLVPTDDVILAKQQVAAYPDNAEAAFILAVALTRTSRVEEAIKEVQRARNLAKKEGGPEYFDKMIKAYEDMLVSYPEDNRVRYSLAWAYYMKAYLLAKAHPANPAIPAVSDTPQTVTQMKPVKRDNWVNNAMVGQVLSQLSPKLGASVPAVPGAVPAQQLPHIKGALELASPDVVPQIKKYYESALKNLDDLLAKNPTDVWAQVYRAHLYEEFTGNLPEAMRIWHGCQKENPNNPAPYFFLATGYLKEGDLKECFGNISRAIALRALGN